MKRGLRTLRTRHLGARYVVLENSICSTTYCNKEVVIQRQKAEYRFERHEGRGKRAFRHNRYRVSIWRKVLVLGGGEVT